MLFQLKISIDNECAVQWIEYAHWYVCIVLKTALNSIVASDKGKNDVTTSYRADPKLSENVCY